MTYRPFANAVTGHAEFAAATYERMAAFQDFRESYAEECNGRRNPRYSAWDVGGYESTAMQAQVDIARHAEVDD